MEVLGSALLGEFILYIKCNWSAHAKVDQRRHRLRHLVCKVRAVVDTVEGGAAVRDESLSVWLQMLRSEATRGQEVLKDAARAAAVASSASSFLAFFKSLKQLTSPEVARLADAVKELERLAGSGGDLDMLVRVLSLDAGRERDNMDIDGARHRQERSGCSCGCTSSVAPGAKRNRAYGGVDVSGVDAASTSRGDVDAVQPQKRRHLTWMRSHLVGLPSGFGRVSFAPRSRRAQRVKLARDTIRRHQQQASLGRQFSRITV